MQYLNSFLQNFLSEKVSESLSFFIYDTIKIIILLFLMIAVVGFLRTYITKEKMNSWLNRKYGIGNLMAAIFGSITPFCSCSSIPIFIGFIRAGIPLGVAFSFLVTSPLVNEYLVVLMVGFFGWKITLQYIVVGILIGVISGLLLGRMKLERYLIRDITGYTPGFKKDLQLRSRIRIGINEARSIVKKIWLWIVVGVGIGAIIHGYIPEEFFHSIIDKAGYYSVPLAAIIGVPIYANCAAIVPVAVVLFEKGLPLGTALAFMMASSALSLPEAIILKRAMKTRLILIFFGTITIGIILIGYLFNMLSSVL